MITILLFLIILLALPVFLAGKYQKRFEDTLFISCASIVGVLFLFGLCSILFVGVIAVMMAAVAFYGITIYDIVKKKTTLSSVIDNIITPATFVFMVVVGIIIYIDYGKLATISDEFSHWMSIVRTMAELDDFGTNAAAHAPFASYPPGMSLFQYLLIRLDYLFGANAYAEWKVYFAYQVMAVATMLPFVKCTGKKIVDVITKILLWIPLLILPIVFFGEYYNSVYVDPYLAIAAASAMALIVTCEKKDLLYTAYIDLACVMLVLTKDVGALMAIVVATVYLIDAVYRIRKEKGTFKIGVFSTLIAIAPLVDSIIAKYLWKLEITLAKVPVKFSEPFKLQQLLDVLNGTDETYRSIVYTNYKLTMERTTIPMGIFGFNYWQLIVLFIVLLVDILIRLKLKNKISVIQASAVTVFSVLLVYGYSLGLLPLYIARFNEYEAVNLASFSRYIGIVMLFGLLLLWMLFMYLVETYEFKPVYKLIASALLLYMVIACNKEALQTQMIRYGAVSSQAVRMQYDAVTAEILENCDEGSDVLMVFATDDGLKNAIIDYMAGYKYNMNEICIEGLEADDETKMDIQNQIDNSDYVVTTSDVADLLRENFGYLFDGDDQIEDNTVYAVDGAIETLQRLN
ncbi:hypothetical protein [Pseudobutyrivibrio sp.]|uniref:hypothetical protein n=1 Tax=Pseudobutyrivibrio sp. TaxID=2014367 RepID=UPI001D6468FF|nr:hypothetical protein [Pseudobutyrivibrio sp.]MBE5910017.1 hypothetical protein [Pseudobutyrivibrio sp.]